MESRYNKIIKLNEEYSKLGGYQKPIALVKMKPKLKNVSFPYKMIQGAPFVQIARRLFSGKCYSFIYEATSNVQDFDRTPFMLMIKFDRTLENLWGLNLHHLEFKELGTFLLRYNTVFPELGSIKKMPRIEQFQENGIFAQYSHALRHYKREGLRSKFFEIDTKYWATLSLLPSLKNIKIVETPRSETE